MYLLEYRNREIPLAGGGQLNIPQNAFIIGTMNTADRSIALVDHALRRRFAFIPLRPDYEVLKSFHTNNGIDVSKLISVIKKINTEINDTNYEVGISFFLRSDLKEHIEDIWKMEIEPYLEEYFLSQNSKIEQFKWKNIYKELIK
jgi:5-methylcytosine-specific restriction protein B